MNFIEHCFQCFLVLSLFWTRNSDVDAAVAKNSSPFDPFRLECPFFHGIVRLDLQRVESAEGVRSDTMVTSFCENIKKLFPSPRDPTLSTADESCRWTPNFRLPGDSFDFTETCEGKEFVSGIARQAFGEYGILCCKLKDRKKGDCSTVDFTLPTQTTPSVGVERGKRLLTAIGHENGRLVAQFCDMEIMTRREIDDEFLANARARLITQNEEDKVRNVPVNRFSNNDADASPRATRPTTRSPSRLSPPGIRPPAGFTQPRGRPGANRQPTTTIAPDNDGDDGPKRATKPVRLPSIRNGLSAPAAQPAKKPPGNPAPVKVTPKLTARPTTTTKTPKTEEVVESDSQEGEPVVTTPPPKRPTTEDVILPDPARFQVLGIPRPAGSDPLLKPKTALIQSAVVSEVGEDPGSFGGTISAGGLAKNEEKITSLPPAPPVGHEVTLPPIEPADDEISSLAVTSPKPSAEEDQSEGEGFPAPAINFGNVSAISNGIVISQHNIIESAVAPPKGLFTIPPPVPKAIFGEDGKNPSDPLPVPPELVTEPTSTLSTTAGIQRLECHSNTAWRDPQSGLVMACGQGDEIWTPARCRPGLLCLIATDSSFRLCCSVRIP